MFVGQGTMTGKAALSCHPHFLLLFFMNVARRLFQGRSRRWAQSDKGPLEAVGIMTLVHREERRKSGDINIGRQRKAVCFLFPTVTHCWYLLKA